MFEKKRAYFRDPKFMAHLDEIVCRYCVLTNSKWVVRFVKRCGFGNLNAFEKCQMSERCLHLFTRSMIDRW